MQYFHMDGRAVWTFAIEAFPQAVLGVLEKCGKKIEEVDLIIPHQANINIVKEGIEESWTPYGVKRSLIFTSMGTLLGPVFQLQCMRPWRKGRLPREPLWSRSLLVED